MHTQTDHLEAEAERTAGILEDRHDEHLTTQARRLADLVVASFTADNPGHWMFHCHILEHQEGGMMSVVEVG